MQNVMGFVMENIGIILVIVSIIYLAVFIINVVKSHKGEGGSFSYRPRNLIAFVIILIIGIYCLFTGKNINTFIN